MILKKIKFEDYWDRIMDACEDTGVGTPLEEDHSNYPDYFATVVVPNNYKDFARWLYNKKFNIDKEISFFNEKYLENKNSREASFQVLSYEFEKWLCEIWDRVVNV